MADSDEDYVEELEDDDVGGSNTANYGTRSRNKKGSAGGAQGGRTKERWEDIQRSWDFIKEGADGTLSGTVEGLLEAGKRKRILKDTTPLQRGIIRHMILVLDMSSAMAEKDMRPSRYLLAIRYAQNFVTEFFEQNPISQLGVLGMKDGLAVKISDLSGNANDHIAALQMLRSQDPKGNPSLQNALDMCRGALFHTPTHGTREVLIVFGALLSSDPGDIHSTIRSLVSEKIRVSVVGLAARIAVCAELCSRTNGVSKENNSYYGVAMNEQHFRELLLVYTTPPVTRKADKASKPSLLMMGFPSRIEEDHPSLCACHGQATRGGYLCSRCQAKICSLPIQCPVCDLQLIQSTHLARSYHHLFPLRNYTEVSWEQARQKSTNHCFACLTKFPAIPHPTESSKKKSQKGPARQQTQKGVSESGRYRCIVCDEHFCIDCDLFAHEVTHNCAGCLCKPPPGIEMDESVAAAAAAAAAAVAVNGANHAHDPMDGVVNGHSNT